MKAIEIKKRITDFYPIGYQNETVKTGEYVMNTDKLSTLLEEITEGYIPKLTKEQADSLYILDDKPQQEPNKKECEHDWRSDKTVEDYMNCVKCGKIEKISQQEPTSEDWLKELDSLWDRFDMTEKHNIKYFISNVVDKSRENAIQEERQRIIEWAEKNKREDSSDGGNGASSVVSFEDLKKFIKLS